jgi:hypothetical protein
MKKSFFFFLLFSAVTCYGQGDTTDMQIFKLPDSTGFGKSDGKLVSREIGSTGGRIASEDGRVELIFPAGALTANTIISIQPITNPMTHGTGKAYQLEPSGTQFKKPVQFFFHYSTEETATCPADLMVFSLQDHSGKWSHSGYESWDSLTKTLKGYIHHFSSIANSNGARIAPVKIKTLVEGIVNINFYDRYGVVQSGPFVGNQDRLAIGNRYWAVNGVREGNDQVGYAGPASLSAAMGAYTAPKIMPKQNPVIINFFFEYYSEILKKEIWGVVSCKVKVYDEYLVEVLHRYTGRMGMHGEIADKGSFVVRVFPELNFEIGEIKNYVPSVIKEGRNGPFKEKIFTDGTEGTIHLLSTHIRDSLSNDYPPEVYFEFKKREITMCRIQHSVRGITGELSALTFHAIPEEINFIANGREQLYNVTIGRGETYKLVVTPHGRGQPR